MEPPDNGGSAPIGGGMGAGAGGSSGAGGAAGTAGSGGFMNAGTGAINPTAGVGGAGGSGGVGGASGMEATGGFGGANAGMGGAGGAGGMVAGGEGGAGGIGADAGADPEAPALECEQGRETVMLLEAGLAGPFPYCTAQLPNDAPELAPMALAVTPTDQGAAVETMWPDRKDGAGECDEGQAFYVDASLGVPRLSLCPALCDALIETGLENVKLELIYGCEPPE